METQTEKSKKKKNRAAKTETASVFRIGSSFGFIAPAAAP